MMTVYDKTCSQCRQAKTSDQFCIRRSAKDGRSAACKQCAQMKDAKYREKNGTYLLEQKRQAYSADPKKFKDRVRLQQKANAAAMNARNAWRYAMKKLAIPRWADMTEIKTFYESSIAIGMLTGEWHEVDHIVPLNSKLVCGLHCQANLQILSANENQRKSNRYWPDMP